MENSARTDLLCCLECDIWIEIFSRMQQKMGMSCPVFGLMPLGMMARTNETRGFDT